MFFFFQKRSSAGVAGPVLPYKVCSMLLFVFLRLCRHQGLLLLHYFCLVKWDCSQSKYKHFVIFLCQLGKKKGWFSLSGWVWVCFPEVFLEIIPFIFFFLSCYSGFYLSIAVPELRHSDMNVQCLWPWQLLEQRGFDLMHFPSQDQRSRRTKDKYLCLYMYGKAFLYVSKCSFGENFVLLTRYRTRTQQVVKMTLFLQWWIMVFIQNQCIRNRIPSMEDNNIFSN